MSVSSSVIVVNVKNFYILDGYEVPTTPDPKTSISLWYEFEKALDAVRGGRAQLAREGYRLESSWNGEEDSPLLYGCSMNRSDGRRVVFEILRKHVEGLPKGQQYII